MKRSMALGLIVSSSIIISSCKKDVAFKGAPLKKSAAVEEPDEIEESEEPEESEDLVVKKVPTPAPQKAQPTTCKEKLDYNPNEIKCVLNDETSNTTWKSNGNQTWNSAWLLNRKANWISPLATIKDKNVELCPVVPGIEKIIYVSHFALSEDQEIQIEAIMDDKGQVRLWKDGDPAKQAYISSEGPKLQAKQFLPKGSYSLVIEAWDTSGYASGAIATVFDKQSKILRQTESSDNWCIFRAGRDRDIKEFLPAVASCKKCMTGLSI